MSRWSPTLSSEVRALLDRERDVPPLPAAVRARALARARAALIAGDAVVSASPRGVRRARWAAAAVLVCMVSAAVGAAAYELRAHLNASPDRRPAAAPAAARATLPAPSSVAVAPLAELRATPAPASAIATPRPTQADAIRAELRLLRQARAAVARGDFAGALPPIAEHARQFKHGRLAEEREALRVRALAGLGRTEEARRAAAAFEARFPRSVLLPAVSQMPASGP